MIEAATTFTSTSTNRSYTPKQQQQERQQQQEKQQQEQHEHLTSLLGFRSEPGHLKCRSSLRGREWHIESALQVPPATLMWHAPCPIYTHTHTHQFAAHMHPNDAHLVRYVWPGQRWPPQPLEPQLSCCPFPPHCLSLSCLPSVHLAGSLRRVRRQL